jgi:hypothetical protein
MAMLNENDLTKAKTPKLGRHSLSKDERSAVNWWFRYLAMASLPDKIFNDMADIENQYEQDAKMSDAQMKYVQDTYEKYT